MRPLSGYLRGLAPGLPRDVYVLEGGALLNAFGNGVVLPFLLIYLHDVRGIPFGLAGSAAAVQSAAALGSGFLGGTLSDRLGPKRVLVAALLVMTVAFALMPLIRSAWHAFAIYTLWGLGSGSFWPSQSAFLAGLTPAVRRAPAYALQRLAMNLGAALGGVAAGLIVSVRQPQTFTVLFAIDCATFLAYGVVLARVRAPKLHEEHAGGSWRAVLRDRTFTKFTLLNAAYMTGAISVMVELLPAFAKNVTRIDERQVGIVFALDAIGIVAFQLPVVKLAEGRRRMRGFALMGMLWAASLLAVWAAGTWTRATAAFAVLAAAMLVFAVGECLHGAIQAPLSVDLAPPRLVGRYLAASSISWQIGWIVGPAGGGFLLQHRPLLLWPLAAGLNVVCAAAALALERRLPRAVRRTPLGETGATMLPAGGSG
ncbi:MAG TPA: MFS transporter [Gaiellaceae bacterium]|jgi:MFS family permease|nr:MFS transporter [Gaiellaceae bacterium]